MQYLLNEEEYKEYRKLKKANQESSVHNRVINEEIITEKIINNAHQYNELGDLAEPFNVAMWKVFNALKSKAI